MAACIISSNLSSIVIYLDLGYKITFFFSKNVRNDQKTSIILQKFKLFMILMVKNITAATRNQQGIETVAAAKQNMRTVLFIFFH